MTTQDMSGVIIPKSDQINADSLLAGPMTIKITGVHIEPGTEQPVTINYEGDNGKPWRPCKSMSRLLVAAWGADAKEYAGRSATLYSDPKVKWGGLEVGGIRVSHLSHIDTDLVLALTMTKGKKAPTRVKPLKAEVAPLRAVKATPPEPEADAFDWTSFEAAVDDALANDAWGPEEIGAWWEGQKPVRIMARAADMARAGKIATRVNQIISKD